LQCVLLPQDDTINDTEPYDAKAGSN